MQDRLDNIVVVVAGVPCIPLMANDQTCKVTQLSDAVFVLEPETRASLTVDKARYSRACASNNLSVWGFDQGEVITMGEFTATFGTDFKVLINTDELMQLRYDKAAERGAADDEYTPKLADNMGTSFINNTGDDDAE